MTDLCKAAVARRGRLIKEPQSKGETRRLDVFAPAAVGSPVSNHTIGDTSQVSRGTDKHVFPFGHCGAKLVRVLCWFSANSLFGGREGQKKKKVYHSYHEIHAPLMLYFCEEKKSEATQPSVTLTQQNSRSTMPTRCLCSVFCDSFYAKKPTIPMRLSARSKEQCNHLPSSSCGTLKATFLIYFSTPDLLPSAVVATYQ